MGVVMAPTKYAKIFDNKYSGLEEFEVSLDQFVFNNFVDTTKKTKMHDGKAIIDILNKKVDISNILALLKFRIRGTEKEKQKSLLINNGTDLCLRFEKIINTETLKDFVEEFKNMPYHEPLTKALEKYEKDNALSHFENDLFRFFKKFVVSNDMGHTLGPYPLFSYLIKREIELRNLFITSRGIDAKFSTEKIRGMII
jgi:vacuolar-type H+-ATPase subunit C/Vma6